MADVTVKLDTTKLDQLLVTLPGDANKATEEAANLIKQQTMLNIQGWPLIDTGALLNSWVVEQIKRGLWRISGGMEYGIYWEFGHRNIFLRRYVRKPFFLPAIKYVEAKFAQMLAQRLFK